MITVKDADVLRPFDDLLVDQEFWSAFEVSVAAEMVPLLYEIFIAGYEAGAELVPAVRKAIPAINPAPLDPETIAQMAEVAITDYASPFARSFTQSTYDGVRDAVLRARRDGTGVEGVISDITPLFGRGRAEAVGITETTRLFGLGSQASYRAQGINAWEWMEVNDPWVCQICAGLAADSEAKPFPMDRLFSPAHPRCRCFPAPVIIAPKPVVAAEESILGNKYKSPADFVARATKEDLKKIYSPEGHWVELISVRRRIDSLEVEMQIMRGNEPVAFASRLFTASLKDVHHSLLEVEPNLQGEGFAALFNARAELAYREAGFKTISVLADIDVGKYTWARQGFDFTDTSTLMYYQRRLKEAIAARGAGPMEFDIISKRIDDLEHAWDVAAFEDGSHLYPWRTNAQRGEGHLGKSVMLEGGSWNGVKQLDPESPSQRIFRAYIEQRKKK